MWWNSRQINIQWKWQRKLHEPHFRLFLNPSPLPSGRSSPRRCVRGRRSADTRLDYDWTLETCECVSESGYSNIGSFFKFSPLGVLTILWGIDFFNIYLYKLKHSLYYTISWLEKAVKKCCSRTGTKGLILLVGLFRPLHSFIHTVWSCCRCHVAQI